MILEIDTYYLIINKLTAHQYIIAKLAHQQEIRQLKQYIDATDTLNDLPEDLGVLRQAELVHPPSSEYATFDIRVTQKFISDHTFDNDPFEELYNAYPVKTVRPNGNIDYLRVDHKRSKKIYYNVIRKNRLKHDFILKCLLMEIKDKESKGNMAFMKRLPSWLTSESWKESADMVNDHVDTLETNSWGYGTDIE